MADNTPSSFKMSDISLWLDSYNDIFSSFDPRPYSERALSVDFLGEAKRASVDKDEGKIELRLLMPPKKRNRQEEGVIKKRLRDHFKKHHEMLHRENRQLVKNGLFFAAMGVVLMFIASYMLFKNSETFLISFLIVLLEPAGWFLFWEGLWQVIYQPRERRPELQFYEKMSKCDIQFLSY